VRRTRSRRPCWRVDRRVELGAAGPPRLDQSLLPRSTRRSFNAPAIAAVSFSPVTSPSRMIPGQYRERVRAAPDGPAGRRVRGVSCTTARARMPLGPLKHPCSLDRPTSRVNEQVSPLFYVYRRRLPTSGGPGRRRRRAQSRSSAEPGMPGSRGPDHGLRCAGAQRHCPPWVRRAARGTVLRSGPADVGGDLVRRSVSSKRDPPRLADLVAEGRFDLMTDRDVFAVSLGREVVWVGIRWTAYPAERSAEDVTRRRRDAVAVHRGLRGHSRRRAGQTPRHDSPSTDPAGGAAGRTRRPGPRRPRSVLS